MYVEEKILNDIVRFLVEFVGVSRETINIFAQESVQCHLKFFLQHTYFYPFPPLSR